jgi:hypothetical protein
MPRLHLTQTNCASDLKTRQFTGFQHDCSEFSDFSSDYYIYAQISRPKNKWLIFARLVPIDNKINCLFGLWKNTVLTSFFVSNHRVIIVIIGNWIVLAANLERLRCANIS